MITARFAAEQGRQVYAIPGRIDQAGSSGCHQLIKEGAILTTSIDDIIEDMNFRMVQTDLFEDSAVETDPSIENGMADFLSSSLKPKMSLVIPEGVAGEIYDCLAKEGSLTIDDISDLLDLDTATVSSHLMMLELKKLVQKHFDGSFELRN